MKPILILFSTREGQTRRIAQRLAEMLRQQGVTAHTFDAAHEEPPALAHYEGVILAASVHAGHHEPGIVEFVRGHRTELGHMPTAFLSVSLSEAGAENPLATPKQRQQARADAEGAIQHFVHATDFRPTVTKSVAGALPYRQYGFLLRTVVKLMARSGGMPTDTSRDHEFTNWGELEGFASSFASVCRIQAARP